MDVFNDNKTFNGNDMLIIQPIYQAIFNVFELQFTTTYSKVIFDILFIIDEYVYFNSLAFYPSLILHRKLTNEKYFALVRLRTHSTGHYNGASPDDRILHHRNTLVPHPSG